jgi:hypothetical protein
MVYTHTIIATVFQRIFSKNVNDITSLIDVCLGCFVFFFSSLFELLVDKTKVKFLNSQSKLS